MYSFEHYIHFVDGEMIENNLPKEVVVNDDLSLSDFRQSCHGFRNQRLS